MTPILLVLAACSGDGARVHSIPGETSPGVLAEVLNANGRDGDARAATRLLRDAGIDVVYFGNAASDEAGLDSTRIVVRRGDSDAAQRVRDALGLGRVEIALDSARLLDVSVFLGGDFAAPAGARFNLHP